ncbi:uncharacterized protein LOC131233311 isoform X2 [Magnolia sinica]|uniref:uncharacterized protein LOC131233311 isoform X2 n=1 Tax=Magnolia sinica TaxID=86752 RepID=UPI00265970AF|nr:uncharacterized protein LOC131233311 isoform X2 [Magnolia sinica]
MSSITRKRSKPKQKSSPPSIPFLLKEPPPSLFPSKEDLLKLFTVVAIASSVVIACNYVFTIFNRHPKPFCDSDNMTGFFHDHSISDFCEPCPNNGECSKGKLECLPGYKKHRRLCVEDGEINQTAKKLFQKADILKELDEYKSKNLGWKNDTFFYSKQKAMETMESYLETRTVSDGIKELKCPDWLAEHYKPLLCCIRQWIYRHAVLVLPICALFLLFMTFLRRVRRSHYLSTRAEQLYEQVCDILEENAMTAKTIKGESEPWVVASYLRDHLLLPRERKDTMLWRKVEELVQEDSRLDQYPKLVKGESRTVWEWQVEGSLSLKRGKKVAASKMQSVEHVHTPSTAQQMKTGKLLNS